MTTREEIEKTFKEYLEATFSQDFDKLYGLLYEYDLEEFRENVLQMARQMDEFGETRPFLDQLGVSSLKKLEGMSLIEFMKAIFNLTTRKVGKENLRKILSETEIEEIEETDFYSIVHYRYPVLVFDQWEMHKGQCRMTMSHNRWQLFLKSGLEASLSRFRQEIEDYFKRKERDKPENLAQESDLVPFSLTGYRDYITGKVVIEPRFKYAGDFSDGLAPVQVMSKYGYIDLNGEIIIQPQFVEAHPFSEGLAAIKADTGKQNLCWGFIDKKGRFVIKPKYESALHFSEGLCPVKSEGKWGYINNKGEIIIPFTYDSAVPFEEGRAEVSIANEGSKDSFFTINAEGNIIKED